VGASTAFHIGRLHRDLDDVATSPLLRDLLALSAKQEALKTARGQGAEADRATLLAEIQTLGVHLQALGLAKPSRDRKAATAAAKFATTCIGPSTAHSVLAFFQSEVGQALRQRLHGLGIELHGGAAGESGAPPPPAVGALAGKILVLNGTLASMSRDQASERIRRLGGAAVDSVSRNTTYLVAGANTGARKTERAAELGVKVLDEAAFLELLTAAEQAPPAPPPPAAPPTHAPPAPASAAPAPKPRQPELGL
jgi:NAD-dependent DNA ligase